MRRPAGPGDDAEHVLRRELEDGQSIENLAAGDTHGLTAVPGDAPRTIAAFAESVDETSLEAGGIAGMYRVGYS